MPAYDDIYSDGTTDMTAGATWGANAKVLMRDQTQAISSNLDVSTNAIDLFHVLGGAPRIRSTAGGTCTIKIDNTYTTDPNVVWRAGGYAKWTFDTNACPLMVIDGGEHVIAGGTVTVLVVASGRVTIESGATVGTLIVMGGHVTVHSAIATGHQSGGRVDADARLGATSWTLSGGDLHLDNTSGSNLVLLNLEAAGRFYPIAGSVTTLNRRGGVIDYTVASQSLTLGSTAFNNYAGKTPGSTGNVTVANLTDYAAYANVGGQGVAIP